MAEQDRTQTEDVATIRQQQHTGNHDKPGPEKGGSDKHGGTRDGAENLEPSAGTAKR
ncbi:MAG: hypothetical protein JO267_10815 [Alphaproteobacteria bacterium]|nr:hypothetical protein [Alphaproteobacteria bacterium]